MHYEGNRSAAEGGSPTEGRELSTTPRGRAATMSAMHHVPALAVLGIVGATTVELVELLPLWAEMAAAVMVLGTAIGWLYRRAVRPVLLGIRGVHDRLDAIEDVLGIDRPPDRRHLELP